MARDTVEIRLKKTGTAPSLLSNGLDCLKFALLYSGMTHLTRFLPASFAL